MKPKPPPRPPKRKGPPPLPVNRPSAPAPAGLELDPDEPAFVLRAGDFMAPEYVAKWAQDAESFGVEAARVRAARQCAKRMNDYRLKKGILGRSLEAAPKPRKESIE